MSGGVPAGWVLVPVEQCDREAAASVVLPNGRWPGFPSDFLSGRADFNDLTQAFARHRLAATPTPPIEGRDADVERAMVTLDAFLAAYRHRPDHKLARPIADDDLLTWGDLRTILAALQAFGERG